VIILSNKSVKEYAAECRISVQSVYSKIRGSGEKLKGHIFKENGKTVLDDYAQELLKPAEGNSQLAKKTDNLKISLSKKSAEAEKYQSENARLSAKVAELEKQLSDKNADIVELKNQVKMLMEKLTDLENFKNRFDIIFELLEEAAETGIGKKLGIMFKNKP